MPCAGADRRMAEDEPDPELPTDASAELRAMVEKLAAKLATQSAELASLKAWKAEVESKRLTEPTLFHWG